MTDFNELATPTLMRAARGVYAQAIREQLHQIGIDDLPRSGMFILAGIDSAGGPRGDLPSELGVTKQAVSQLVDTLVRRDYLRRRDDPDDRRRVALELTPRGHEAVGAGYRGVEAVDQQLDRLVSAEQVAAMRATLAALAQIKLDNVSSGASRRRQRRALRSSSPIFPVGDLPAALEHYSRLGFKTFSHAGGEDYGFANRDGVSIHLATQDAHPALHPPGAAYLFVRDADSLFEQWRDAGAGGETLPPGPTDYGLREGRHTDLDGNLIRFGSPIEQ